MQMVAAEAEALEAAGSQGFLREAEHLRDSPGSTEKAPVTRFLMTVPMHHGIKKAKSTTEPEVLALHWRLWQWVGGTQRLSWGFEDQV